MRDAAQYYNEQLMNVIGYGIVVIIPIWLMMSNYSYLIMTFDWGGSENVLHLFMNILMFVIFVRPLFSLYKRVSIDEEMKFKELLKDFLWSIGPIAFLGISILVLVYAGLAIFIVPGILILPLVFVLPFIYDHSISLKVMIKKTVHFYMTNFSQIWLQIILWVSLFTLVWTGVLNFTSYFEMNLVAYTITRLLFSILIFPFIIFYVSEKFLSLREGVVD